MTIRSSRLIAVLTLCALVLTAVPAVATPAAPDIEGHWAEAAIEQLVDMGAVSGLPDGTFRPDLTVTRAEFVTMVNKSFGITPVPESTRFQDVKPGDWFGGQVEAAAAYGYVTGNPDGTFSPYRPITREQAAAMLVRVFGFSKLATEAEQDAVLAPFADADKVSAWAKADVATAISLGLLSGYTPTTLAPQPADLSAAGWQQWEAARTTEQREAVLKQLGSHGLITRAQTAAILVRALALEPAVEATVFDQAGTYGPEDGVETISGDVIVKADGVTLQNLIITGDLIITESVGDGTVVLENVTVKGDTEVKGGGTDSVIFRDCTLHGTVTVEKVDGQIRIVAEGSTSVPKVVLQSGAILISRDDGSFERIELPKDLAENTEVVLTGNFAEVEIAAENANVTIGAGSTVNSLVLTENATGTQVDLDQEASVTTVTADAEVEITGQGTIGTAEINVDGVTIEQKPDKVVLEPGVKANVGGKDVTEPKKSTGGGGGRRDETVSVSAISVDPVEMYLELEKTATIKATVLPGNATNKRVTWTTSDESIATVANGVVTPVAVGEATITATTVDGGFTATCVVSVINPISESADVVAGDFSVMTISDVIGYNVGFILDEAKAFDVKDVVVTLYGEDDKVLATSTSAGILEKHSDQTSLSAPFDVFGNFDYVGDGCWDYSGWLGLHSDIPIKAEITVTFKNGAMKTVSNVTLSGVTDIFSKKVVNTNTLVGYDTIQEAINAAEPGHVLNVAPGTYEEPVIINNANLTVKSTAGAEKTILDGDRGSVTLVNIKADGVTFSGFTLQNAQKGISINSSNNSITNNIVADVSYWSIELNGTGNYLEGNLVKDQGSWGEERQPRGIFLYGATNAKLRNNKLVNAGFSSGSNLTTHDIDASNTVNGKPVYYWVDKTEKTVPTDAGMVWLINCDKMTVQGLHIDSTERAIYVSGGSHHKISNNVLGDAHGSTFPKQKNITHRAIWVTSINDSEISYNTIISARSGIEVEAGNNNIVSENTVTDSRQAIVFNGGEGNSARGNVLVNFVPDENYVYEPARWTAGFTVWNSAKDTRLEGNHLANFEWGINQQIDPRSGGKFSAFGTVARDNIIIGSIRCPAATNPIPDRVLDARYNYWGFKEGPCHGVTNPDGQGQPIGDNILFYPWYENEDLTQQYFIGKIVNSRTYSAYRRIQEAVDQAQPGDTIWVDSGTFAGDLTVDKEGLALESLAGADATTISGNIIISGGNVTIEGFTIDGEVEAPDGFDLEAIFDNNVFPEGSRIIGNKIMVPADGRVYNLKTGNDYTTIQEAVDGASAEDVILVAAGTYKEVPVTINKALTLEGPNAGIPGYEDRANEAVLEDSKLSVSGSSTVVIDGLHFYQTNDTQDVILLGGSAIVTVQNCIMERNGEAVGKTARGITTSSGIGRKIIKNNLFTGDATGGLFSGHKTWNSGVYINGASSTVNIEGNIFENCRTAANLDDFCSGITLSGNTFSNNGTHISFGGTSPTEGKFQLGTNDFKMQGSAIVNLSNVAPSFRLDITSSTFAGSSFSELTTEELLGIETAIYHRGRSNRNGLVTYVADTQFVVSANPSIQAAVDAANPGDTIFVGPGEYSSGKTLQINKRLTLEGVGATKPVIKDVININSGDVVLRNLECTLVERGQHNLSGIEGLASIYVNGQDVLLDGIVISGTEENKDENGRAVIGHTGAEFTVTNSEFTNVKTGIFAHSGYDAPDAQRVTLVARNNTFEQVWAGIGGTEQTDLTAEDNTFISVQSGGEGIGLGKGAVVTGSPGDDTAYLEGENTFKYNDGDKVRDYRN